MTCIDITPIIQALSAIYDIEEIDLWLSSPQPLLGGAKPEAVIAAGGYDQVLRLAQQLIDGVYL